MNDSFYFIKNRRLGKIGSISAGMETKSEDIVVTIDLPVV